MTRSILRWASLLPPLLFFIQGFFDSLDKSLTWDEPTFIVSGYTYLTRNDFRFNPEAPPLMQQIVAIPLLVMDLKVPPRSHPNWRESKQVAYAKEFMRLNTDKIQLIAIWTRLPVLILGSLLIYVIYFWGRQMYGDLPALYASLVAALSPNLIAHGKLATRDLR